MTKKDKDLLLKDLLGRVLYGVKVDYHGNIFTLGYNLYLNDSDVAFENYPMPYFLEKIESVKPYLRTMSSMTEEEQFQLGRLLGATSYNLLKGEYSSLKELLEYFYKKHIDLFDLIPKGLALEAPEDMYKSK